MQGLLGGHARPASQFGRIDFTDDVGEFCSRCEPLGVALASGPPGDWYFFLRQLSDQPLADSRYWAIRVIVHGCSWLGDIWDFFVQEANQGAHEPAFGLALLPEKQHVMAGGQRDINLGDDCAVIANDSREQLASVL